MAFELNLSKVFISTLVFWSLSLGYGQKNLLFDKTYGKYSLVSSYSGLDTFLFKFRTYDVTVILDNGNVISVEKINAESQLVDRLLISWDEQRISKIENYYKTNQYTTRMYSEFVYKKDSVIIDSYRDGKLHGKTVYFGYNKSIYKGFGIKMDTIIVTKEYKENYSEIYCSVSGLPKYHLVISDFGEKLPYKGTFIDFHSGYYGDYKIGVTDWRKSKFIITFSFSKLNYSGGDFKFKYIVHFGRLSLTYIEIESRFSNNNFLKLGFLDEILAHSLFSRIL